MNLVGFWRGFPWGFFFQLNCNPWPKKPCGFLPWEPHKSHAVMRTSKSSPPLPVHSEPQSHFALSFPLFPSPRLARKLCPPGAKSIKIDPKAVGSSVSVCLSSLHRIVRPLNLHAARPRGVRFLPFIVIGERELMKRSQFQLKVIFLWPKPLRGIWITFA